MLGFLPGFAYMGEVDEKIAMPRKPQPVTLQQAVWVLPENKPVFIHWHHPGLADHRKNTVEII